MTQDPLRLDFTDQIAREMFRRLLHQPEPLSAESLATVLGLEDQPIIDAFARLKEAGRAEFDEKGRLLGVYGLTLEETEHRLVLRKSSFFVWCAFDSVGIPAALGESAKVSSVCAQCGGRLDFAIDEGRPPELPLVISWVPRKCDSVRDEFCPTVNFYCDVEHFRASLGGNAPEDAFIDLQTAATIGRENWGWAKRGANG